jgi:hypothetical protein
MVDIVLRDTGAVIGVTGFHKIDAAAGEAHWCVVIARGYQREGFAREAWEACAAYAKTHLAWAMGVRVVVVRVPADNHAMRAFLEKKGPSPSRSPTRAGTDANIGRDEAQGRPASPRLFPFQFAPAGDDSSAPGFGAAPVGSGAAGREGAWVTYRCELEV